MATRNEAGRPTHTYFQRLTANIGYMKLVEHPGAVVATLKLSSTYADFIETLDHVAPRYGQNGCCHSRTSEPTRDLGYDGGLHRAAAAFLAIAFRLAGESLAALAFPPFWPPNLPSATAAGFLPEFGSSSGVPSMRSPMACSPTRKTLTAKS